MTITYNIQKVHFALDQVEEKGQVDVNQAIKAFQDFPFQEQLLLAQTLEQDLSPWPGISFITDDGQVLSIWAENENGFEFQLQTLGNKASFYVPNDFKDKTIKIKAEDFISVFFSGNDKNLLDLAADAFEDEADDEDDEEIIELKKQINANPVVRYSYAETKKLKHLLGTIPFIGLNAMFFYLFTMDPKHSLSLWIPACLGILWLPSFYLHLTYWLKNKGAVVSIDRKTKTLYYEQNGQLTQFGLKDIKYYDITESSSRGAWRSYRYVWFNLNDKRRVLISCFVAEPEKVLKALGLDEVYDRVFIPIFPL